MPKTILIVEDNELNMKLLNDLLEANGYDTVGTADGQDVLELTKEHRPDLILMDIHLPNMSGIEATKIIKAEDNLRHIPIIAVTACAMAEDEEIIRQGGCEGYIAKPISISGFLETVAKFIG